MFDNLDFPQKLDEELFDTWLEKGRLSKIRYNFLLIIWDSFESNYLPIYAENREAIQSYERYGDSTNNETLVAAYHLYSEGRIS